MNTATKTTASLIGIYAGLLGLEHGYFETMQGNVQPSSLIISAIGSPCQPASAWHACEPAMTIIPNFLMTGLVAMIVSLIVVLWSAAFVQRRSGALILILLSMLQLLVGGGFIPVFIGMVAGIAGTGIRSHFTWWCAHLSTRSRRWLVGLWPWSLVVFLLWGVTAWVLGSFFNDAMLKLGLLTSLCTIGTLGLAVMTAVAHDLQKQIEVSPALSVST